jgi:hypothetical protein
MQNKYYYLIASLPYLEIEEELKINEETFLYECKKWLTEVDLEALNSAVISYKEPKEKENSLILRWREFDGELKKELAAIREAKKNKSSEKSGQETARNIIDQETPLLMEQEFEKIRWRFLDNEESKHDFDINSLVIYYLKLQILERLDSFDKEKGEEKFYKLCEVSE